VARHLGLATYGKHPQQRRRRCRRHQYWPQTSRPCQPNAFKAFAIIKNAFQSDSTWLSYLEPATHAARPARSGSYRPSMKGLSVKALPRRRPDASVFGSTFRRTPVDNKLTSRVVGRACDFKIRRRVITPITLESGQPAGSRIGEIQFLGLTTRPPTPAIRSHAPMICIQRDGRDTRLGETPMRATGNSRCKNIASQTIHRP